MTHDDLSYMSMHPGSAQYVCTPVRTVEQVTSVSLGSVIGRSIGLLIESGGWNHPCRLRDVSNLWSLRSAINKEPTTSGDEVREFLFTDRWPFREFAEAKGDFPAAWRQCTGLSSLLILASSPFFFFFFFMKLQRDASAMHRQWCR